MRFVTDDSEMQTDQANDQKNYFSPRFLHWLFGEKEQIFGYEGLSVEIILSCKRLIPLVQISYDKKAPAFANIDNIEDKLTKHYGKMYTDSQLFDSEVLEFERTKF
mmetsp:Transcript_3914/g.2639  ORF Transcript_3914/g.2639 Transcript_3914/m.2639 type:complete len:106 (-) Transcript_3914:1009-1326(-)